MRKRFEKWPFDAAYQNVTIAHFAAHPLVGVDYTTIRRWIKRGLIPAKKLGPKMYRIPLDEALAKIVTDGIARNPGGVQPDFFTDKVLA